MTVALILGLVVCLALGLVMGGLYFAAMWWSAELFATGSRMQLAIALTVGRFALILAVLALVAIRGGALPLLATAIGVVIARAAAMWRVKAMAL